MDDSVFNAPSFINVAAMVILASAGAWLFQMILVYDPNKEGKK
jgi:hypothetical protein